ncbi:hypothetical protein Tco_1306442 [Tanacetum coccineum]
MNPRFLSDNIVDASLVLDVRTTIFVGVAGGRCKSVVGDLETKAGDVPMEVVKVAGDAPSFLWYPNGRSGHAPGQSDTDRSLLALRDLGYCTILVYKELSTSPSILKVADLDIYWRDLATGFLEVPLLKQEIPQAIVNGIVTGVFWDVNSMDLPLKFTYENASYENAFFAMVKELGERLNACAIPFDKRIDPMFFNVYGRHWYFPKEEYRRDLGIRYIPTTDLPRDKKDHIENVMMADMLSFTIDTGHLQHPQI